MKVLIVTYYWPPSGGSGVQRWLKFAKYLPEFGCEPVIYTVENGEFPVIDESLLNEVPPSVTVIKRKIWEPFNLYKAVTGQKKNEAFGHGFAGEKKGGGFKGALKNLAVWIRGNFFIPDARKFWVRPSVKYLENYLRENNIQHVITTGPPHSMHLIGLQLKKKMNIKWIADFRDPWTGVYYFDELKLGAAAYNKHRRLEKEVLLNADKVITVGPNLEKNLALLAGEDKMKGKTAVITNGYDSEVPDVSKAQYPKEFSIVYTGLFSSNQNHAALWEAMSEVAIENADFKRDLKLRLYGKIDHSVISAIESAGLKSNLSLHAHVSLSEIGKVQREAAVLLLCINHYPGEKEMLTGKLFDYICSLRPILNVGPVDGDAAAIIEETKTGGTFERMDKIGIKRYLQNSYSLFVEKRLMITPINLEKYSRRSLTKELSTELSQL